MKSMIHMNLKRLRSLNNYTQEMLAEEIGVSRQMGTWESTLDIAHCIKLAELYDVTLENLVNHNEKETGLTVPPKGKHMFGSATVRKRTNCYS